MMSQDSKEAKVPLVELEKLNHAYLTSRAIAASISIASAYGISVEEPHILADAYSVRVHLKPAPSVLAKFCNLTIYP